MAPEEESRPESSQNDISGSRAAPQRNRRSSRGRRGHGRGGKPKPSPVGLASVPPQESAISASEPEQIFELAEQPIGPSESVASAGEAAEAPFEPAPTTPVVQSSQSASTGSVEKAIEEVSAIVDTLRNSLDDMEDVLEMLELFERQKNADEREIESLRRALRQIHRPRDAGHHSHR